MTNISIEELKKRAELLKIARQLLNKDYINRRAQQHQLWITNSETSWKATRSLLPYPPTTLYPSEEEVVAKALELYNNSANLQSSVLPLPEVPPTADASANPDITTVVTAQLQAASASVKPSTIDTTISSPWVDYLQPNIVTAEVTPVAEPIIEPTVDMATEPTEEVITEPTEVSSEPSQETSGKHSLLRNVLSGWLQKNKDKET